jgi:hypothetical protein
MGDRQDPYITGIFTARHIASHTMSEVYCRLLDVDDRRGARIVLDAADAIRAAIDAKIADEDRYAEVAGE